MTTSIGCREPEVYDAQRRVQAERPGTEGWRYAQRTAIRVRAAFWIVKRTEWDAHNRTDATRPPLNLR
jgi:hypothetical protein